MEPSVPAREFNLKAYAAIACRNDGASLGLEPRLAASDHRSRTVTLATAPLQQADLIFKIKQDTIKPSVPAREFNLKAIT